jgi:uncharacterized membrane protein YedE/YeeE
MIPPRVSLFTVLIGVRLRGLFSMVRSIQVMSVRDMSMMPALFMRSFFVMPSRLLVVARCVLMMFSGFLVMFRAFMLGHFDSPLVCTVEVTDPNRTVLKTRPCQLIA